MDGNELCMKCKQQCDAEEQYYKCDSCLQNIHKKCLNITPSEVKCMPLQKRILLLICEDCKQLIARMPYMVKLIEDMKKDIESLKSSVRKETYANVLQSNSIKDENNPKISPPTLVFKPKKDQRTETSRKEIQNSIDPAVLNVGIRNIRETKRGNIVIKCDTDQDLEKFKNEAVSKLKEKYSVVVPKKLPPKIKIIGYTGNKPMEEIEESIKRQNRWIVEKDYFKITYVKKQKNKSNTSTIYAECSGDLLLRIKNYKRICIDWERLPIYEDLSVSRCYKCQGFYHKSYKCERDQVCGNCAGNHSASECDSQTKKCVNCLLSNKQYNLNHNTSHSALDTNCPSLKYHLGIIVSRTDYNL